MLYSLNLALLYQTLDLFGARVVAGESEGIRKHLACELLRQILETLGEAGGVASGIGIAVASLPGSCGRLRGPALKHQVHRTSIVVKGCL